MKIGFFSSDMVARMTPPPAAGAFFIGDPMGGSGWEVEMPDGSTQPFYVDLPDEMDIELELHLPDPPTEHLGQPITDTSVGNPSRLYIDYLRRLVNEAERHFRP
jgi:hypothetical protein